MEGKVLKSVILCVLILGLVVEQIQVEGKVCCPNTARYFYYKFVCRLHAPPEVCAPLCDCQIVDGTTCPSGYQKFNLFPNSEEALVSDYCKLGCTSSVCDTINTDVGSDAVEHCNNACSRFCTKDVKIAMVTAIQEVRWLKPTPGWTKANMDGAAKGQPGNATCGGVFRMYRGFWKGAFSQPLGEQTTIFAEMMGFINAVEVAILKGWLPLWIESDSATLVYKVRKKSQDVPLRLKQRWSKCLRMLYEKDFMITYIFREGNALADVMANMGFQTSVFTWWHEVPQKALRSYNRNLCEEIEYKFNI